MALSITYFDGADRTTQQCFGRMLTTVEYTVTGSSASCGTPPEGANIAYIKAGEACNVTNNGDAASATNGVRMAAGDIITVGIINRTALLAKT